ncbi:hypothetical protein [Microbacterium lacticum]
MTIHNAPALTRRDGGDPAARTDVQKLRRLIDDGFRLKLVDDTKDHTPPPVMLRSPEGRPSPDAA